MQLLDYILCHGSGNRFVMIDAVRYAAPLAGVDPGLLARDSCRLCGGLDGLLLLVRDGDDYGMRMFNPDGSEAEMCGNGIRCVARLAREYVGADDFHLLSGGRRYAIGCEEPVGQGIPTFGVEIPLRWRTDDFVWGAEERFVDEPLPALAEGLRFTYLNPGNPHLVARVERIDLDLLRRLGHRVTELRDIFPRGVNVSLYRPCGEQAIFVSTFERGAGITSSCGTAMTSCSTAACLAGLCRFDEPIDVSNSGGRVRCLARRAGAGLQTRLTGNATFEAEGRFALDAAGRISLCGEPAPRRGEIEAWAAFVAQTAGR